MTRMAIIASLVSVASIDPALAQPLYCSVCKASAPARLRTQQAIGGLARRCALFQQTGRSGGCGDCLYLGNKSVFFNDIWKRSRTGPQPCPHPFGGRPPCNNLTGSPDRPTSRRVTRISPDRDGLLLTRAIAAPAGVARVRRRASLCLSRNPDDCNFGCIDN